MHITTGKVYFYNQTYNFYTYACLKSTAYFLLIGTIITQYTLSYGDFTFILRKWKEFVPWSKSTCGPFPQTWHSKYTAHFKDSSINYAMLFILKDNYKLLLYTGHLAWVWCNCCDRKSLQFNNFKVIALCCELLPGRVK